MIKKYTKGKTAQLSNNFTSAEFDCHGRGCCAKTLIDSQLVGLLQKIRDRFGCAVTVNSGYRCAAHNKAVGGAAGSYHTKGQAADIVVKGIKPAEVAKYAESIGINGIGLYDNFVHIDTRTAKSFWYSDKQERRDTFGGAPLLDSVIKAWQNAANADGFKLTADGIWGKQCEAVAQKAICRKRLTYKYKNLTKIVQKAVGVTADGKFGTATQKAVIAYQRSKKLTADGCVGLETWKAILGVK